MPQLVIDAIIDHTMLEARMGCYEAHDTKAEQLSAVYRAVANLIETEPKEIALVVTDQYKLRNDARRFENWENSYALRAGLGVCWNAKPINFHRY